MRYISNSNWVGHPSEFETFEFSQHQTGSNGRLLIIRSHVAYDSNWPWWRRAIANLRGRK